MKSDKDFIILQRKKSGTKWVIWAFVGIILFIAVYIPFFGMNLRYQTSYIIKYFFNILGTICLTGGGLMTFFGVTGIFIGSRGWMKNLLLGGILLWIGCWLTGIPFILFEAFGGGAGGGGGGYH